MQLVRSNRTKPDHRRPRHRPWPIIALGRLRTPHQFELEERRQDVLDRRWRRWQSIVFTLTISARTLILPLTVCLGVLTGAILIDRFVDWLLSLG